MGKLTPLNDAIISAVAQLVDDAQTQRRDPSHSDLSFQIRRASLSAGDPNMQGQTVGKAKRVRSVLSWSLENDLEAGGQLIVSLIGTIRGHGGFRHGSSNYVGKEAVENAIAAFDLEGYQLSSDGELRSKLLDNLSGEELTDALNAYIRRAKRGAKDAALVTGTGKDLLEAVAAHILFQRLGTYPQTANFPTLLGQTFVELKLATPASGDEEGAVPYKKRIESSMYELACGINQLRNKQGTGHGRPWMATVTDTEARIATEFMGVIAEYLLMQHSSEAS